MTKTTAPFSLRSKSKRIDLSTPCVMGILNATPDSFYARSRVSHSQAVDLAGKMLEDGAALIDIGGHSTRPSADDVSPEEELARVIPVIEAIVKAFPDVLISIDTFQSMVAEEALEAGAALVNDVSAAGVDGRIVEVAAKHHVPYVLMHMQGSPQTMQKAPAYENLVLELLQFFDKQTAMLKTKGVHDIIIDPGFGFGKTVEHNYQLMAQLNDFKALGLPLLVGISRKSMVYKPLKLEPQDALNGTTALHMVALERGTNILRAHDVKEAKQCIDLFLRVQQQKP